MMRVKLVLLLQEAAEPPWLDYNYQHSVASAFYDLLIGTSQAHLHDEASDKFFSFSRLYIDSTKTTRKGIQILGGVTLWYTTPDKVLLDTVISSLEKRDTLTIEGTKFRIVSLSTPYSYQSTRTEDTFITMSPVLLRKVIEGNGALKQWEMSPEDSDFAQVLVEKLKRKYEKFAGKNGGDLEVISVWDTSKKMIHIVDLWHRAYYMKVRMKGSAELLNFVYDCGLGEKNSMGFGMVRSPFDGVPVQTLEHLMGEYR